MNKVEQFHAACRAVVKYCPDEYAKAYAVAGLDLNTPDYIVAQCLYILSNMSRWRGPLARGPRTTFQELSKRKSWKGYSHE